MTFNIPFAYRRSFNFAVIVQAVAIVLSAFVDDNSSFLPVVLAGWIVFWVGVVALINFRAAPSKPELVAVRYCPLGIFFAVFVLGCGYMLPSPL